MNIDGTYDILNERESDKIELLQLIVNNYMLDGTINKENTIEEVLSKLKDIPKEIVKERIKHTKDTFEQLIDVNEYDLIYKEQSIGSTMWFSKLDEKGKRDILDIRYFIIYDEQSNLTGYADIYNNQEGNMIVDVYLTKGYKRDNSVLIIRLANLLGNYSYRQIHNYNRIYSEEKISNFMKIKENR